VHCERPHLIDRPGREVIVRLWWLSRFGRKFRLGPARLHVPRLAAGAAPAHSPTVGTSGRGNALPLTPFSSVTDGLDGNRRSRAHFTAHIEVPVITRAAVALVLLLAGARPMLLAQTPACDDAAIMALNGKWIAESQPRPQGVTVEQYQQAAKRTDAAHALLLETYPDLAGMQMGGWWRVVGGPGVPGLLSYYYVGALSPYFCAPNAEPGSMLAKLGAPTRPVYDADGRQTNLRVYFNSLVASEFLRQRAGMIVGGLQVFERPRAAGVWKGRALYVNDIYTAGNGLVVVAREGMQPFRPLTRKQYLEFTSAAALRQFDDMIAAQKQALDDPKMSAFKADGEQRLAQLFVLRSERNARDQAAMKRYTADGSLDVPAIVEGAGPDIFSTEEKGGKALVTLNPDYFRTDLPAYVPQVIILRWQVQDIVSARHFGKLIEANLPIDKFQAMIDRQ